MQPMPKEGKYATNAKRRKTPNQYQEKEDMQPMKLQSLVVVQQPRLYSSV